MARFLDSKTLYGENWKENRTETLNSDEKNAIRSISVETSEMYGTKQFVFHMVNGTRYFKAHRDCANLPDGTMIDKNTVKLVELLKPSTGETTVHAYGVAL
jgi:hypothetical protein